MHDLTQLIKNDMKPALGVTEPGAIAYAVAVAKGYISDEIIKVEVLLNSGMYKNAFTCGIPGTNETGNLFAAALGVVAADASLGLEALGDITEKDQARAKEIIAAGKIVVKLDHMGSDIDIRVTVASITDICQVHIEGSHTNIREIKLNNTVIFEMPVISPVQEQYRVDIHRYTVTEMLEYVRIADESELAFIKSAFTMNMDLVRAGLNSQRTTFIHQLYRENGNQLLSDDVLKTAQLLCNGAIEARVLGLDKPAMSITGSGAHGIIATLPLYAYYKINIDHVTEERLLQAAALSYLITIYIKEYSGKLSAFCGCGIAAGTGMACGLSYLMGGGNEELVKVIQNMAAGITGMICDGGNQGCVMKGIVATDAAFRAADMAKAGIGVDKIHGIVGNTPELTMKYMGRIASPGMTGTEQTIVSIMEEKGKPDEQKKL